MSQSGGRTYPRRGDRVYHHELMLDEVPCTVEIAVEWPTAEHPVRCSRVTVAAKDGAGVTTRLLMKVPLRDLLLQVQQDEQLVQPAHQRLPAGPKGHPPEFYAGIAEQWVQANLDRPDPTRHLAGVHGVSDQAFRRWLGRARELGWLPPPDRQEEYLRWVRRAGVLPYTAMQLGRRGGLAMALHPGPPAPERRRRRDQAS